jgi:short-subunit dehydrogenase
MKMTSRLGKALRIALPVAFSAAFPEASPLGRVTLKRAKKIAIAGGVVAVVGAGTAIACTGALAVGAVAAVKKRRAASLRGKVVVITGGSRGLGLALAEEFGRRGARLVLTATDSAELERAKALLLERSAVTSEEDVFVTAHDLRRQEEAEQLIAQATAHFGRIDVLVNNAGVITVGPVENQRVEDFREAMESNFFSGLQCTLAALPQMLARGQGSIVNITSIRGKIAVPHLLPYVASKFAAVGFSEGLNMELRAKGIKVTTVCPGLMRTGSHGNALYTGDAAREYRWFSLGASLPVVSASAQSAARKVVRATMAGTSEIAITPQAMLAARFADVCPTATMRAMQVVNMALPSAVAGATAKRRGAEVRGLEITHALVLGNAAARRYNETS